jgi:hypothetical protein
MKRSESISSLAKSLAVFNSKVSKVSKDANNPFFKNKYATLDNIIDEVRPLLTENGLTLMQFPSGDGNLVSVTTYLMHESGEWIESDPLVMKPVKNDPQAIGSCITYARRYSLASFLSLNTGEDDDGNKATHPNGAPHGNTSKGNGANKVPMATKKQMDTVHKLVNEIADIKAITKEAAYQILQKYMKKDMEWYTEDDASKAIQMLNKSLQQGA